MKVKDAGSWKCERCRGGACCEAPVLVLSSSGGARCSWWSASWRRSCCTRSPPLVCLLAPSRSAQLRSLLHAHNWSLQCPWTTTRSALAPVNRNAFLVSKISASPPIRLITLSQAQQRFPFLCGVEFSFASSLSLNSRGIPSSAEIPIPLWC